MKNERKLLIVIIFCFCIFIYSYNKGNLQKEIYMKEADLYLDSQMIMYLAGNGKEAIKKLEILKDKYPNNYVFQIDMGYCYMLEGKYEQAQVEFEKALKQRQSLINKSSFLYKYGKTLYENGDYTKSKYILKKAKSIGFNGKNKEYQIYTEEILKNIKLGEK